MNKQGEFSMSDMSTPIAPGNASVGTTENTGSDTAIKSGDAVTFEDLDVDSLLLKQKKSAKKEDKKPLIADAKPEDKSDDKKAETKEKDVKAKDQREDKDQKDLEAKIKKEIKKLKYKSGDQDLDIDEEAIFRHRVSDQDVDVPLKELLSNYSGKTAWDKKFSELNQERQTYKHERSQIESRIKSIMEAQDPEERFYKMAEMAGKSPVEVRRKFLEENMNLLEKFYSMSDDEKKADELQFENKFLKSKAESFENERVLTEQTKVLSQRVNQVSQKYGITEDDLGRAYQELNSLQQQGKFPQDIPLTPEFLGEAIRKLKYRDIASQKIQSLGLDWAPEVQTKELNKLADLAFIQDLDPADLSDIVDSLWGSKMAKKVLKDKAQDREEFMTGKKKDPEIRKSNADIWSFDQLTN